MKKRGLDDLFAIDASAKGSCASCGIVKYTVKATSGVEIASIKGTGADTILNINMATSQSDATFDIVATTKGGKTATKQLSVKISLSQFKSAWLPGCSYKAKKYQLELGVSADASGVSGEDLRKAFSFGAVPNAVLDCEVEEIQAYSDAAGTIKAADAVALATFSQGFGAAKEITIYFRVGKSKTWSGLFTAKATKCGDEELVASDRPRAFNFIYDGDKNIVNSVGKEAYADYFTITGNQNCGIESFATVTSRGGTYLTSEDTGIIDLVDGRLKVNLDSGNIYNSDVYLQATTIGGKKAQKLLQVTIKKSNNACTFEASPYDLPLVYALERGKKIKIAEEIMKTLTVTPEDDAKCPVSQFTKYRADNKMVAEKIFKLDGNSVKYPPEEDQIVISGAMEVPYTVRFGGDLSYDKSNAVKAIFVVCGLEDVALAEDGPVNLELTQNDIVDYHTVPVSEYSKWFSVTFDHKAASSLCTIDKYRVVRSSRNDAG